MGEHRHALLLGLTGLSLVLSLVISCSGPRREASPDITATSPGGVQAVESVEDTPDVVDTAQANTIQLTQSAQSTQQAGQSSPVVTPTLPPSTLTPTLPPTTPTPTTSAATSAAPTPTSPPTGYVTHVVQRGENLFRIALRYGTTVQAIASANGIANPALIRAGQTLKIPSTGTGSTPPAGGSTYVVKRGDNLFRIALRYNMNYVQLAQYNGIANPARIYVGQILRIPPR